MASPGLPLDGPSVSLSSCRSFLEVGQFAQRLKMFWNACAGFVLFTFVDSIHWPHVLCVNNVTDEPELAAILQMSEDFAERCAPDLQGLYCWTAEDRIERKTLGRWLLRGETRPDETDQLIPGLAMRVAVLAGVNGGEFPLFLAGERRNGL